MKPAGEQLSDHATKLVKAVKGCDYVTLKADGYTVTVQKDTQPQRIQGFQAEAKA